VDTRREQLSEEVNVIGYTEDVLVSGTSGTERVVAKSDTGASRTSIDTRLAAEIGAGPIKSMTKVKSGSMKSGKARPVVDIVVGVAGDRHTVAASLEDRGHMEYPCCSAGTFSKTTRSTFAARAVSTGRATRSKGAKHTTRGVERLTYRK